MRKKADQKETVKPGGVVGSAVDHAPDAVERIGGSDADIIPEDMETDDILPHDIKQQIDDAIYDFMTYECKPPIEDMSKARQPRWSACCMYIGQRVNKKLLRQAERGERGKWNGYKVDVIDALIPLWVYYCSIYDKAPLKADFGYFAGLSIDWINEKRQEMLTPERVQTIQKISYIQENGLSALISDGSRNPTGAIAILNHWHNWTNTSVVVHTSDKQAISAVQLPKLSDNSTPG